MAVVPGGNFGTYFTQYNQLSDSRKWNTKNYDYATVKNKGEVSEDAKNEDPDIVGNPNTYGTNLNVKVDKYGYFNNGRFIKDEGNPTYQIRDKYDRVDNNYYVDQKTGDVYFRPAANAGAITFPATTPINVISPQYFGTTFNLDKVLNPEDFGGASLNRLIYSATGSGLHYTELTVNGVQISTNGIDTTTKPAIPALPADALYNFSNSFQAGVDDFTPVHPKSKWVGAYQQWPGAITGVGTAAGGVGPPITVASGNYMWYPDTTDTDYNPAAANNTGITDALFRKKIIVGATVPTGPINLELGAEDQYDLFINGQLVTSGSWPNSQTVDIQPFLVPGENIIGIHASDPNSGEAMYVQMQTADVNKLGSDLSVSAGGWEASVGALNPFDALPVSNTFTDQWTYEPNNQRYTNSEPGRVFRQTYFNNRTTDNFIMKANLSFLDTTTGLAGQDWAGFMIRAEKPDSLPTESGYTVAVSKNGDVVLYKAHADILLPNPLGLDPITGLQSSSMVAKANIAAFAPSQNLEIHANGTNIQIGLAGSGPVINWTDTTNHPYTDGYTSFVTDGPHVAYDNFQLYSYTPEIQLLSRALKLGENNIVIKGYDNSAISVNVNAASNFGGVALGTNNILPNLNSTDIMDVKYKASSRVDITHPDPNELDPLKAYWSVSQNSALGIAGKIFFQNREGGSIQRVKDEFSRVNSVMQNMTSLLGSSDDLFKSHLNIIR